MEHTARNTHPMIIVAAIVVTIASPAGLLPAKSAPPATLTATAPPPAVPPAPSPTAEHFTVRFEDGSSRWQVGDRVRPSNGKLLPN